MTHNTISKQHTRNSYRVDVFLSFCVIVLLTQQTYISAQETLVDESELFADTATVVHLTSLQTPRLFRDEPTNTNKIGFSANLVSSIASSFTRNAFTAPTRQEVSFSSSVTGNFMIDARLSDNCKAYGNTEITTSAFQSQTTYTLRELFMDINLYKWIYIRSGKQVLQWGSCSVWNPTDLINVEKKSFIPKIGSREGAYGVRLHFPYKTICNAYGFLDLKNAVTFDSLSAAVKVEYLAATTEIGCAMWSKPLKEPVFGVDVSTYLFHISVNAEAALCKSENTLRMKQTDSVLQLHQGIDTWPHSACVSFSKSFDFLDVKKRIHATVEFYYTSQGYDKNIFRDTTHYTFEKPMVILNAVNIPQIFFKGTKKDFLLGHNLYEMNNCSPFYVSFSSSITKFFHKNLSLALNSIINTQQECALLYASVFYINSISNYYLGIAVTGFVGPRNSEYTFTNNALSPQIIAQIAF